MDDIIGLVVEQIARRARAAAAGNAPVRVLLPNSPQPAAFAAAPPPAAAQPVTPVAMPPTADGGFPFGSVLVAENAFPSPLTREPLLSAFASREAFLAAFVLSEALALPVALREPRSA